MARHGENIRKRADGRWEGRYQAYSEKKERIVYRSVYGRTYQEVRERVIIEKSSLIQSVKVGITKEILFSDAARDWLVGVKKTEKPSTFVKYTLIYNNYLEKSFGNISLHKIPDHVAEKIFVRTLSDSVQKSIRCVLNQILKSASRKYSIPMINLDVPPLPQIHKPVEILTRGEQACLFSALYYETDIFKMAVILCFYTGLRLGELCGLKWSDIDFTNKILRVSRTVQRLYVEGQENKTALIETMPKSEFSNREIPLPDNVLELLSRFQNEEEYVFGGHKPVEPRTMQNRFRKLTREAGLQDKNFHILRHTFATNCVEEGTDVKSLSEILGHSDVRITLNRYVHPSMETKRRHIDALSVFYGQICGQAN